MVKKRRRHTAACKFRGAPEALEGSRTISYPAATDLRQWACPLLIGNIK